MLPQTEANLMSFVESKVHSGGTMNEDASFYNDDLKLYIIADGMGGYEFGHDASSLVVKSIKSIIREKNPRDVLPSAQDMNENEIWKSFLTHAVGQANIELCKTASERKAPMGSTATSVLIRDNHLYCAHVGDCRLYVIDERFTVKVLTREHRAGEVGSNLLERSLGKSLNVACDTLDIELPACFSFILCTDGVWSFVPEDRISEIVRTKPKEEISNELVRYAVENGSDDDVTAICVESANMSQYKEKIRIEGKKKDISEGSKEPQEIEEVIDYYVRNKGISTLMEYFPLYLKETVSTGRYSKTILGNALKLLHQEDQTEYNGVLRNLWEIDRLPEECLPDLVRDFSNKREISQPACSAYERYLQRNMSDIKVRGLYGICLLDRGREKDAIEHLRAAFSGSSEVRENLWDTLRKRLGSMSRKSRIELSVSARIQGIITDIDEVLKEASIKKDEDTIKWVESLINEVADNYPSGSDDQIKARKISLQLVESRESTRLRRDVEKYKKEKDEALQEINRLTKECDRFTADLRQLQNEKDGLQRKLMIEKSKTMDYEQKQEPRQVQWILAGLVTLALFVGIGIGIGIKAHQVKNYFNLYNIGKKDIIKKDWVGAISAFRMALKYQKTEEAKDELNKAIGLYQESLEYKKTQETERIKKEEDTKNKKAESNEKKNDKAEKDGGKVIDVTDGNITTNNHGK